MSMTQEQLEAKVAELEGLVAKADEALKAALLEKDLALLNDEDKTAYDGLTKAEMEDFAKADQEGRDALLKESASRIAKAAELPVDVQKRFDSLKKSLDETNAKLVAAETIAKQATEAQKMTELRKQAETEFSHLSGTADEKAQVLKSIYELPETACNSVLDALRKADEAMAGQMQAVGKSASSPAGDAWGKIEQAAQVHVAKGLTKEAAISKTLKDNPELYTEYLKNTGSL